MDRERWNSVLSAYKQISPVKCKVMAHYWNPTNYNNRDDLVIPVELADPALFPHTLDDMDELHLKARGSYPYEINTKTRWFNSSSNFEEEKSNLVAKMFNN